MPRMRLIIVLAVVVGAFMALAPSANASWTHLGGDPLFPGGIKGSGQTARNDFVRKMNTGRAAKAMRLAGLNATERKAVRHAVNKGQFKECKLNYGDHFQKMSFGAGTIFVDRNVTFADPSYKGTGAPAFCLTVKVKYKNGKVTTIKIKVPFKCFNIAVVSKKTTKKGKKGCGCKTPPPPPIAAPPGCTVIVYGDNSGNAGCGNVQICTANGNYNGNPTVCSAYNSCIAIQGNTWDSTQNVCSSSPPPPPPTCPDNRPVPPSGDCDRPPIGEVVASAAHIQTSNDPTAPAANKHVELYFEGSDPDGDTISLDILLNAPAGAYVSGKRKVLVRYDNSPCPAGITCWQATLWSGTGTGVAYVSGKFSAGDKYFVTDPIQITIAGDTYPTN